MNNLHTNTLCNQNELQLQKIKEAINNADAIVIGAGAGLSTAAGFVYGGERFQKLFADFIEKYGYTDEYTGGFRVVERPAEEFWAFWSRNIYINRYTDAPKSTYQDLLQLVQNKEYFVLTTNVDHCFQKAGFDKQRLFYTQGDFGLLQCSEPCHKATYDNEAIVKEMVLAQGFVVADDGSLQIPTEGKIKMTVPTELIPLCPRCGEPMTTNLRADGSFVQDKGWYRASSHYDAFIKKYIDRKVVYLELGVGYNTPGIIKYPFWKMTYTNPKATYICLNYEDPFAPKEIEQQSICVSGDTHEILQKLLQ